MFVCLLAATRFSQMRMEVGQTPMHTKLFHDYVKALAAALPAPPHQPPAPAPAPASAAAPAPHQPPALAPTRHLGSLASSPEAEEGLVCLARTMLLCAYPLPPNMLCNPQVVRAIMSMVSSLVTPGTKLALESTSTQAKCRCHGLVGVLEADWHRAMALTGCEPLKPNDVIKRECA